MKRRLAGGRYVQAAGTSVVAVAALAWFGFATARAAGDPPPNTGMAAPLALVAAYDRFAAGGVPPNLLGIALRQLRGARSAPANPATLPESFRN